MALILPYDPSGVDARTASVLDDLVVAIQTWAGRQDGAGKWQDVAFDAGNFVSGSTGAWTVQQANQRLFRYAVVQDVLLLHLDVTNSTTSAGMGSSLRVRIPGGYRLQASGYVGVCQWSADTAATDGIGRVFGLASPLDNLIALQRDALAAPTAWPSSEAGTFSVRLNVILPVYRDATAS